MKKSKSIVFLFDSRLMISVVVLSTVGIVFAWSSSIRIGQEHYNFTPFLKQLFFFISGLGLLFLGTVINYKKISEHAIIVYLVSIAVLIFVLLFGKTVNGSKRWIDFYFFTLQPSEFVKVFMIIVLATWLDRYKHKMNELLHLLGFLVIMGIPMFLIFLEPDLGTSLVLIPIALSMLLISGTNIKYIIPLFIMGTLIIAVPLLATYATFSKETDDFIVTTFKNKIWILFVVFFFLFAGMIISIINFSYRNLKLAFIAIICFSMFIGLAGGFVVDNYIIKPYQKERIIAFVTPNHDKEDVGYNVLQSRITLGSGGFWGKGIAQGTHGQLGFLPSKNTDFIFSVIGEELGFIGSAIILFFFWLLLGRIIYIAKQVKDSLGGLIVVGVFAMFSLQIFVNVGMTLGITPVTGIPLPFVTAGGSTLWTSLLAISLVFNVELNRYVHK